MGKLTRFYDRISGQDGPVSGALQVVDMSFEVAAVTNVTIFKQLHLPAGMAFEITDIEIFCGTVTSDPLITIGDTAAGTQVVASTALATGANVLTVKDGTIDAGGLLDVRITADTGDAIALPIAITVVGHVAAPPTSVDVR